MGDELPGAAVGKRPKLGGLKQRAFILSVLDAGNPKSVSLGRTEGVSRAVLPPEALGENFGGRVPPWSHDLLGCLCVKSPSACLL